MRPVLRRVHLVLAACLAFTAPAVDAQPKLEKIVFATNWAAQAEHGGYYQALVDGEYARCGLDVTIQQGGPQVNNRPLLPVGKVDFLMGGNLLNSFDAARQKIPTVIVAAHFQRDPQALMTHPDAGYETFEDLKKAPVIFISAYGVTSFFQWMRTQYGFREEQVKPYQISLAPFLQNKRSVVQAYLTAEPHEAERLGKIRPKLFLLADHGWSSYATTVETRIDLVQKRPQVVQCFVDASAIGWYTYLYGDRSRADAVIRRTNPEMTAELLAYSIAKLKEYGIVDSGDALRVGIGAMSDARMQDFHEKMVRSGLVKAGEIDMKRVYTLQFVNRSVGLDVRKRLVR